MIMPDTAAVRNPVSAGCGQTIGREGLKEALRANAALVEEKLRAFYPVTEDPDVALCYRAETYSLLGGGKRIRPFLTLEFCRLFRGNGEAALCFAAGIEMMHTFSLIHDDLPCMDDDDLRRGRPTSHKQFGEATALLCGDALSIRAFAAMSDAPCDATARVRAVKALAEAAGSDGMIGGQLTDLRGETERLDMPTLHKLHGQKTGAMIRLAARLGCIAAGLPESSEEYRAAYLYAAKIGLVFQIIDDILDVTSDAATMGKSVGGDAQDNKTTFMTYMTPKEAFAYAEQLTEEAKAALRDYPGSELLSELADYLLTRQK